MKKTFPVNINGKVFYIDEDAYELLSNYLTQLRAAFCGAEGDEIVTDIESRISELFDERVSAGANAITFADVNGVIEIMGKPADIGDMNEGITPPPPYGTDADETAADNTGTDAGLKAPRKRLYRNLNNKVLGGVFGGLSTYLGWDANIMRLLYVALCIATYVWPLVLLYLIAWMIIPPANNPRRILELQGNPVTVDNIGQEVLSSTPPQCHDTDNSSVTFVENAFSVLGKFLIVLIGL
ncbi:MAG: PspC domain-containing protein, partial [Muribaculaceae bacterium]|nr:PspC domain-containing protein [Muribaculaceae bacterium]